MEIEKILLREQDLVGIIVNESGLIMQNRKGEKKIETGQRKVEDV
jgi:hypothetical protein